jgi:nickel-dependent lactate racemase
MRHIKLRYGKNGVKVSIPDNLNVSVINLEQTAPLLKVSENLRSSLYNPYGCKSLSKLAESANEACTVVSDKTRFVPDQWEVQELVKVLEKCTVKLYSESISEQEIIKCHCAPVKDLSFEIAETAKKSGNALRMAFIPDWPYTLAGKKH